MEKFSKIKMLSLIFLGVGFEFFDFIIFSFFSSILINSYFNVPTDREVVLNYIILAIGMLGRLIGGFIFGYVGDKYGRKNSFIYCIYFMAIPCLLISALPTYGQIGIIAPILLIISRLLQGCAIGGELPTAISLIAEFFTGQKQMLASTLLFAIVFVSFLLAVLTHLLLTHLLSIVQLQYWGWRIAFLFGGIFGLVNFTVRKKIKESPKFLLLRNQSSLKINPITYLWQTNKVGIFYNFITNALTATFIYIFYIFLPNFLLVNLGYSKKLISQSVTFSIILCIISILIFGFMSHKFDKKTIYKLGCLWFFLITQPIFWIFSHTFNENLFLGFGLIGIFSGSILAPIYLINAENFLPAARITGIGISLNLATVIFGSLGGLACTLLTSSTQDHFIASYFIMGCCVLSYLGLLLNKPLKE